MVNQSSRYKLSDGTNFQYQDLGGDILAVPEEIKSKLKQWNKKQKLEEIEMDVVEKVEKFKISSYDRTINYTSVKICLEKGMFFRDSQNYDSWVITRDFKFFNFFHHIHLNFLLFLCFIPLFQFTFVFFRNW